MAHQNKHVSSSVLNFFNADARDRGDYYRENFVNYWSPDRLLELGRDGMRTFKQNILNADLDCRVGFEDREKVIARIEACLLVL